MNELTEKIIAYMDIIIQSDINLKNYAQQNNIPIYKNDKLDKGWKGNVVEHLLNIKKNNNKGSDFQNLEIKTVPVILNNEGYKVQETTCLSVLKTEEVIQASFQNSSLYQKVKNTLFILINVEDSEAPKIVGTYYLNIEKNLNLKQEMENDYNTVAEQICDNISSSLPLDFNLTGKLGKTMQPRPKSGKKGNYTWAFYLKTHVLNNLLNIQPIKKLGMKI